MTEEKHILDVIFERLEVAIGKVIPGVKVLDEYPKGTRRELPTPAAIVELVGLDPSQEQEPWGSFTLTTEWEIRLILSTKGGQRRRAMWAAAASLVARISGNSWDLERAKPARVGACLDEGLDPQAQGYEVWKVNFYQDVVLTPSEYELESTYILKRIAVRENGQEPELIIGEEIPREEFLDAER